MKKTISFLIIICMLLGSFPPMERSYGATYQVTESNYQGFNKLSDYQKSLIDQLFIQKVKLQNSKGMYVAIKPLENQHVTVYNWNHLTAKGFGQEGPFKGTWVDGKLLGAGEYRYLGYDYYGNPLTNDKYTNGPVVGDRNVFDLPNYTYYKQEWAEDSWKRVTDPTTTNHMLEKPFISEDEYRDTNPKSWTMKSLLSKTLTGSTGYGGTLSDNSLKPYLIMQTPASLNEKGSMRAYGRGKNANGDYVTAYNTFNVDPIDKTFKHMFSITAYEDKACTKVANKIEIPQDKESVKVYVKLNSNIDMDPIKLKGQETKYIEWVTHTLIVNADVNNARKVDVKDLSVTQKVNNIYEVTLNKKDYSSKPKTIQFKGVSTPKIRYSLIHNITVEASTNVQVTVADPTKLKADFTIHHGADDKTDDIISIKTQTIESPITLALKDTSSVPANNAVVNYNWFVFNHTKNDIDYFGYTKDTSFTIDPTNKTAYVKDGVITFKEMVVDKVGNREWAEHKVTITSSIPIPPPPEKEVLPVATIAAPGGIRAGKRCGISGEGTSANGPIISYDFSLASNFKVIEDNSKDKTGTFLSFDHSVNNDWTENSSLTVTDSAGKQDSDEAKTYVKHPLDAVFKTRGVYKIHRTITLDSTESTGTEFYPIDKVTWTIKPMDGQSINVVKPHVSSKITGNTMTIEGAAPNVDFKQLGRYEVWMDVHSTCTFSGETHRTASKQVYGIITIAPDEAPIAKLSVPRVAIRDYDDAKQANITVWDESYSPDGDSIGKRKFYARRDTDNDKKTDDETWQLIYEGTNSNVDYKTPYVGYYEFKVEVEEVNDSITSPFWNAVTDTLRANSDTQSLIEKQTEVLNVAPITSIMAERKKLDLVLVTDYEGSDYTALKAELDVLTKDLFEKGVDIEVKVFKDNFKNGTVKAPLYTYTRYLRYSYTYDANVSNDIRNNYTEYHQIPWETKTELETAYLPSVTNNPISYTTGSYNDFSGEFGSSGTELTVNAPYDPYLKNGKIKIRTYAVTPNAAEYYNNIRNIQLSMDQTYTKEKIASYVEQDLLCLNLDKLRSEVKYRDGSDRQMLFVVKTGNSLTQMNQAFADYIKQNTVTVSAISGFDMASQAGGLAIQDAEWLGKEGAERGQDMVNERDENGSWSTIPNYNNMVLKGVGFKLENGKTMAVLNPNYTVAWNGVQYRPNPDYPVNLDGYVFKYPNTISNSRYIQVTDLKTDFYDKPHKFQLEREVDGGGNNTVIDYLSMEEPNTKTAYVATKEVYGYEDEDSRRKSRYTVPALGDRTLVKHMSGAYMADGYYYFVKNNTLYRMPHLRYEEPWQNAEVVETGVYEIDIDDQYKARQSDRLMYSFPDPKDNYYWSNDYKRNFRSQTCRNYLIYYSTKQNKTRYMKATEYGVFNYKDGYGSIYYHNYLKDIDQWLEGKPQLVAQNGYLKMDNGFYYTIFNQYDSQWNGNVDLRLTDVKSDAGGFYRPPVTTDWDWGRTEGRVPAIRTATINNGYWYIDKNNDLKVFYKNNVYPITQGMNIKKYLVVNDMKEWRSQSSLRDSYGFAIVFLTNDGKLLTPRKYNYNFSDYITYQNIPLTPDQCDNLVKDPRILATPVVNALSMRKLLNQSSANRISGSFNEFGTRLRADYDYLKYQTKVTLLLGETLKYDQLYYDREGDPLHDSAIAIQHDQNALESPIGTDPNNGQTLKNWDNKLNKTGLYKIQPKVQDSPSSDNSFSDYRLWNKDDTTIEVLVHRKPIASMKLTMTPTAPFTVTARDSNSRDLDHISMTQPLRGITEVEWGIKKLYADEWEISKGALNTLLTKALETGETYIVSYRVKDVEGAWSDPVTEQIVAGMNLLLDAKLKPENPAHNLSKFQTGNNLIFHDLWTSYPLAHHLEVQMFDGATPILNKVTLRKEWNQVRAENYPERDWHDTSFNIPRTINGIPLADKTYSFVVTAFDSSNPSIKKQKQFQVTTVSNSAPTVSFTTIEPTSLYEGDSVRVSLKVDDPDKDLLNLQVYIRYDGQEEKLLETHKNIAAGSIIGLKSFELPKAKLVKFRAVVTDPMNASGEAMAERPIQQLGIETVALKGAWNHWRGQVNAFGQQMTNEPYRFLGYEKVSLTITTRGGPESVNLRLEGPLEAMQYVDSKGHVYKYQEEIGTEVSFPIIFKKLDSNKFYIEYILPIANSTITWDGQRKRPPYQLFISLTKDGRTRKTVLGDEPGEVCIDMTGNIFDLVFNQPSRPKP